MRYKDMKERFGAHALADVDVNPMRVVEHQHFSSPSSHDYRGDAIDECVREKLDFASTCNVVFEMAKRYVKVSCPKCRRNMENRGGGGSGTAITIDYHCKHCDIAFELSMQSDGMFVSFPENE